MLRVVFLMSLICLAGAASAEPKDDWLVQAKGGNHLAQYNLCKGYLYGENGLPESGRMAYKWCVASADAGISHAQTLLAEMYRFGTYVKQDDATAGKYYLLAANQGHVHAQYMLGRMATLHDPLDWAAACHWLMKSADQGYDKAKELLDELETQWQQGKQPGMARYCDERPKSAVTEGLCGYTVGSVGKGWKTEIVDGFHVLKQLRETGQFRLPESASKDAVSIQCYRSSVVPDALDRKVLEAGFSFYITTDKALVSLTRSGRKIVFSVVEGSLDRQTRLAVENRMRELNASVTLPD